MLTTWAGAMRKKSRRATPAAADRRDGSRPRTTLPRMLRTRSWSSAPKTVGALVGRGHAWRTARGRNKIDRVLNGAGASRGMSTGLPNAISASTPRLPIRREEQSAVAGQRLRAGLRRQHFGHDRSEDHRRCTFEISVEQTNTLPTPPTQSRRDFGQRGR